MPEGHLVHRHARELSSRLRNGPIHASSAQGLFDEGAAAVDGRALADAEACGKHLFLGFDGDDDALVHVHLGRQWLWSETLTPPRPSVRLRLVASGGTADLIAPIVCELGYAQLRGHVVSGLGPDPLRDDADAEAVRDHRRRDATRTRRGPHRHAAAARRAGRDARRDRWTVRLRTRHVRTVLPARSARRCRLGDQRVSRMSASRLTE
jgi:formamidopyrimidine-DNA glycosylase